MHSSTSKIKKERRNCRYNGYIGHNNNSSRKKKKTFGLNAKCHQDMLLKLVQTIKLVTNASNFENKILELRKDLLPYMNRELIPPEQGYFMIHLVANIAMKAKKDEVLSIVPIFCRSSFVHCQLSVHLLTWRKEKTLVELREIAESCLLIFERGLLLNPLAIKEMKLLDFRKFLQYLKNDKLQNRLDKIEQARYNYGKRISKYFLPPTSENTTRNIKNNNIDFDNDENEPLIDFRQLSTIPKPEDIFQPFPANRLKAIKKYGAYKNGEDYLDTTYKLLREDLISPFRDLIKDVSAKSRNRQHYNVTIFENVQILYPNCTHRGITYRIAFDETKFRGFPWESCKKLLFGSLVCFSKDNFQTLIFGTVSNRDAWLLKRGELDVKFVSNEELHNYTREGDALVMLECPTFFEAYRHVMDCFKELDPYAVPMQKYIVECKSDIPPPQYLRNHPNATYDLTTTFSVDKKHQLYSACKNVLMNKKKWRYNTILNKSQLKAIKHALTHEFALIQGPPGTGKTFCGLRIANALLVNKRFWNKDGNTPMIIVAYTNHALDQFLTGLTEFGHEGILRVGSRIADHLDQFSMDNAKEKFRSQINKNDTHKHLRYMKRIIYEGRDEFANDLGPYLISVKKSQEAVKRGKLVFFKELKTCMDSRHVEYFAEHDVHCKKLKISIFDIFLELCKIPTSILKNVSRKNTTEEHAGYTTRKPHERTLYTYSGEDGLTATESETINIFDEGNALKERWVIDESEFKPISSTCEYNAESEDEDDSGFGDDCFLDDSGFQLVTMSRYDKQRKVRRKLNEVNSMTSAEASQVKNPWDLTVKDRWRIYKYWLSLYMKSYDDEVELLMQQYEDTCSQAQMVQNMEQEYIMRSKDVVAMTTSCASRCRKILERIKPKIVIIEEAAEVMEAHVVSSLLESTEHCILIGDHKQLRPNPAVYALATTKGLELSLFERMVENGLKCVTLNVQHRMRPEISHLLRHIYPDLQNHASVMNYPCIDGVSKNLFFINHSHPEKADNRFSSKANIHEARFIKGLCFYILQQGYDPEQITVLTGYSGQLMQLKNIMPKDVFEGVKVTSVDNFQGEENDIILLSLVRSNSRNSIGFLKTENRICVALSRAKMGLYVIGNFQLLASQCSVWKNIVDDVKEAECFGDSLTLYCQKHSHTEILVNKEADFLKAPEGGCMEICNAVLPCLHVCKSHCHPHDPDHEFYVCQEICTERLCQNPEHSCGRKCHKDDECGSCQIPIEKVFSCGHTQYIPCSSDSFTAVCQNPCLNVLSCGHDCSNTCGQECTVDGECPILVQKLLPCGHMRDVPCSANPKTAVCNAECPTVLRCGHTCSGSCSSCRRETMHIRCVQQCGKIFNCGHICTSPCGHTCNGCEEECYMNCEHSACELKCNKKCKICDDPCTYFELCPHQEVCQRKCGETCDSEPCDQPCDILLPCEHSCTGVCGERCPPICRICNNWYFSDIPRETRFIVLEDCNHHCPVDIVDAMFKKSPSEVMVKCCPCCDKPIVKTRRYQKYVRQMKADLRQIEKFVRERDEDRANSMKEEVFRVCHSAASLMLLVPNRNGTVIRHVVDKYNKPDFQLILHSSSLQQFSNMLDLKYLSREGKKPAVLLIAERLVQATSAVDVERLYNQIRILEYVYEMQAWLDNNVKRNNQTVVTLLPSNDLVNVDVVSHLNDITADVISTSFSIQQGIDVLRELERTRFEIYIKCVRNDIKKRLKSDKKRFPDRYQEVNNITATLLPIIQDPMSFQKQYAQVSQTISALNQKCKFLSLRLLRTSKVILKTKEALNQQNNDFIWYRCLNKHLYTSNPNKPTDCPKCPKHESDTNEIKNYCINELSDSGEEVSEDNQESSKEKMNNLCSELLDLSLTVATNEYQEISNDANNSTIQMESSISINDSLLSTHSSTATTEKKKKNRRRRAGKRRKGKTGKAEGQYLNSRRRSKANTETAA